MSRLSAVLPADLCAGDLVDLAPLLDRAVGPLSAVARAAAESGYATVLAVAESSESVFIRTDVLDVRVHPGDLVDLLIDEPA